MSETKLTPACLFCKLETRSYIKNTPLAFAIRDGFPITEHHTLIIPHRHVPTYFDLNKDELDAINALLTALKNDIEKEDPQVTGFNIGINNGESAGQTIFHCHIHLIPRRDGDVKNPRGGVRHTIPGKGFY